MDKFCHSVLALAALASASAAHASEVTVPPPAYPDGESGAWLPVPVQGAAGRILLVTLSLEPSASNNAEVVFGDGVSAGWDCGGWSAVWDRFRRRRAVPAEGGVGGARSLLIRVRVDGQGRTGGARFFADGAPLDLGGGARWEPPPALPGSLRVVSRGAAGTVTAKAEFIPDDATLIIFR